MIANTVLLVIMMLYSVLQVNIISYTVLLDCIIANTVLLDIIIIIYIYKAAYQKCHKMSVTFRSSVRKNQRNLYIGQAGAR